MKRSLFIKVFGVFFFVIMVLAAIILFSSFRLIKRHHLDSLAEGLERLTFTLEERVTQDVEEGRVHELDDFLKTLGQSIRTRITVIDPSGIVLADSEEDPSVMESHRFRPEVQEALEGRTGRSLRFSTTVKEDMLYVGRPLYRDGRLLAVLRTSSYVRDIEVVLSGLKDTILHSVLIIAAAALFIALLFARSLTRPIRQMIEASERIASGDFAIKVYLKEKDELGELGRSLNLMTERLKELFEKVQAQKEELAAVISSMHEGLIVLDKSDRIVLANTGFKRLFAWDEPEGKTYWEVLRSSGLNGLVGTVKQKKTPQTSEVRLNEKTFLCRASFLEVEERTVVSFHDRTEEANLERMKKGLVVSVSHELRTPLTAIKGFAETLEEGVDQENRKYVHIIIRNTERLIHIVKDLLVLAELEEKELEPVGEGVDFVPLARNVLKIFEPQAGKKGLQLDLRTEGVLPVVKGDSFKLEQMLVNLIDNALKYTETGEVVVTLSAHEGNLRLEVRDTGSGIPPEHLPHIFERFYVVDKSRSRGLGGTGLGLSIVKHIVLLHGGSVDVRSEPGKGTAFSVLLPAAAH